MRDFDFPGFSFIEPEATLDSVKKRAAESWENTLRFHRLQGFVVSFGGNKVTEDLAGKIHIEKYVREFTNANGELMSEREYVASAVAKNPRWEDTGIVQRGWLIRHYKWHYYHATHYGSTLHPPDLLDFNQPLDDHERNLCLWAYMNWVTPPHIKEMVGWNRYGRR